jgi:hypothetical protein
VFLELRNAQDIDGPEPETESEWKGSTRLIHAHLGLSADRMVFGVHHRLLDASQLVDAISRPAAQTWRVAPAIHEPIRL